MSATGTTTLTLDTAAKETPPTTAPPSASTQPSPAITVVAAGLTANSLPCVPGLKVRAITQPQQFQQRTQEDDENSLLKLQLRAGLKEISLEANPNESLDNGNDPCAALQSLASVAERQAPNAIQPPSANNLQHQFLLHMATNPIPKNSHELLQQQQQQQQQQPELHTEDLTKEQVGEDEQIQQIDDDEDDDEGAAAGFKLILDSNDGGKSDTEYILSDDVSAPAHLENKSNGNGVARGTGPHKGRERTRKTNTGKPIQRRRIRRKAQSTIDDQAEHLTEMSVRGLDLFRYASVTEGVYQCTECAKEDVQKTFKNKYSFQRHAFLYHEGNHRKVFPCLICGKEFSRPDKMKNHLKMTHEGFVSKDMAQFGALNFLLNAAAAGDMQQHLAGEQQHLADQLAELPRDESAGAGVVSSAEPLGEKQAQASPEPAMALIQLQNDIIIKNEIVISPSPSPPPPMVVIARGSRLEEVK